MINNFAVSKNTKRILMCLLLIIISIVLFKMLSLNSYATGIAESGDLRTPLKNFYKEYKGFVNVFMAFVVLSNILIFIYHFVRLGMVSTNPQERSKCLNDMLISGVCFALIGGGAVAMYILFFLGN